MFLKVKQIKDFGIFHDFSWQPDVPDFKQFNLIYGWNRSGKTTFSRIFSSFENNLVFPDYESGTFKVKDNDGNDLKSSEIEKANLSIKVFNSDFIKENIFFDDQEKHCNPIIYISEEDIEDKKRLSLLENDHAQFERNLKDAETKFNELSRCEEQFRIAVGSEISNNLGWKSYNKTNVKNKIDEVGMENFTELSEQEFNKNKKIIIEEAKKTIDDVPQYQFQISVNGKVIPDLSKLLEAIKVVLEKKVTSETIKRLEEDNKVNNWVKQGFDLHTEKAEKNKCLFCQNTLSEDFLESLNKHFNKDYENLQSEIANLITEIGKACPRAIDEQMYGLYSDLQSEYQKVAKNVNSTIDNFKGCLTRLTDKLKEKKNAPFSDIELDVEIKPFAVDINKQINELNEVLKKHNSRSDNHSNEVKESKKRLEAHYIGIAIKKQNYPEIVKNLKTAVEKQKTATKERNDNFNEIERLQKKTSSIGKAIPTINKHLENFFGQKEVQLELDEASNGYVLKRNGKIARNLSEGEKTAIAFSYFITKVQEKNFDITKGLIFIDDPISSFDSNYIYHCFAIIKNHFKNAGQLYVSTHNFEFFNLIKEWFLKKNSKKQKNEKDNVCEFYMIENGLESDKRYAYLTVLDETLKKFKSEYHFLFHLLNEFCETKDDEYKKFYIIGNIARRFLEIFTNFKIPKIGDLASKIGELDTPSISYEERDKVYKLINDFSHFIDPVGTVVHKDKSECKTAVKILLKMIEEADSKHYQVLKNQITSN